MCVEKLNEAAALWPENQLHQVCAFNENNTSVSLKVFLHILYIETRSNVQLHKRIALQWKHHKIFSSFDLVALWFSLFYVFGLH